MRYFFVLILFFCHPVLRSQTKDSVKTDYVRKPTLNSIYIQILGTGIYPTIDYERILIYKQKWQLNASAGVFFYNNKLRSVSLYSIPFELGLALGSKNHVELGVGLSYVYGLNGCTDCVPYGGDFVSSDLYSSVRIGYKYKKADGHFYFAFGFTPLIRIYKLRNPPKSLINKYESERILPMPGVSVGYSF
jgi:hypothetical protein